MLRCLAFTRYSLRRFQGTSHYDPLKASSVPLAVLGLAATGAGSWMVWRWNQKRNITLDEEVDFLIVGAGSAGCALAARLSQGLPNMKILLVEAGEDDDVPEIQTAVDYFGKVDKVFTSDRDWGHGTESENGLGGRGLYWPRGKVVGGCSSFNTMVWMRPEKFDMDSWAKIMHDDSWGYETMLQYFRRAETHPLAGSNPKIHGDSGPIAVARLDHEQHGCAAHEITKTFVEAAHQLGHPKNEDFGAGLTGVGINEVNAAGGKRCSSAAYLRKIQCCPKAGSLSAKSGNLEVRLMTQVTRIVFEGKKATGVEVCDDANADGKHRRNLHVRREIVLCGGAVNTPHLLLLSGVGPAEDLEAHQLPIVANLPGVGKSLQDHLHVAMSYRLTSGLKPHPQSNICEGSLFTRLASEPGPNDLQVHCGTVFFEPDGFYPSGEGFTLTPTLIRSKALGSLRLRSADPFDKPEIIANYLRDQEDILQFRNGVKLVRRIGQEMLKRHSGEEVYPGPNVQSDSDIDAYVKKYANTVYHPACSCRAGPDDDPLAVLDNQMCVRGVDRLRVADASAMPSHVGCNTNATCTALGEKAGDLIIQQYSNI